MNGSFIVIEGSDGSGKTTQFKLLAERLKAVGYDVETIKFPQYESPSSHFVKSYLSGSYGPANDINPYTASLFYALDRYEAAPRIRQALAEGKIVLSDRYVSANMVHQGSKFSNEAEQRGFFIWEDSLEYQLLGVPRPNLTIILKVPAEISHGLIKARADKRSQVLDEHEKNIEHLEKTVATYESLCQLFPRDYKTIDCVSGDRLMGIAQINDIIWNTVLPYLSPQTRKYKPSPKTVMLDEPNTLEESAPQVGVQAVELTGGGIKGMVLRSISLLAVSLIQKNNLTTQPVSASQVKLEAARFYAPSLKPDLNKLYSSTLKDIELKRLQLLTDLKKYLKKTKQATDVVAIEKGLQPLAATISVSIQGTGPDFFGLTKDLERHSLSELTSLSAKLTGRGHSSTQATKQQSPLKHVEDNLLSQTHSTQYELAVLVAAQPRLEFDLLGDRLFDRSELSRDEIAKQLSEWDYPTKTETLNHCLAGSVDAVDRQLRGLNYTWDLVIDGPDLSQLVEARAVDIVDSQWPTPRFGYSVPDVIEAAGLSDLYIDIFDQSLMLYSKLQDAGYAKEAGYAVLAGYRQRWRVSTGYRQLATLRGLAADSTVPKSAKDTLNLLFEALAQVHPQVAKSVTTRPAPQTSPRPTDPGGHNQPSKSAKTQSRTRPKTARTRRRKAPKKT